MRNMQACLELAARQHGLVTREQLHARGVSRSAIARAVKSGLFERVLPEVYRSVGAPKNAWAGMMAAALWIGPGGAVSHAAAGWLHELDGLERRPPSTIDLLIAFAAGRVARDGLRLHRSRTLDVRRDVTTVRGIRCTTLPRTLLDLAGVLEEEALEKAVDGALRYRRSGRAWILKYLETVRGSGVSGVRQLWRLVEERGEGTQDSGLEVEVKRLIEQAGLPRALLNVPIVDAESRHIATVDFAWPKERVVLQAHGYRAHSSREAFEKDFRQSSQLTASGWRVLEVTSRRLRDEREAIIEELRQTLKPTNATAWVFDRR